MPRKKKTETPAPEEKEQAPIPQEEQPEIELTPEERAAQAKERLCQAMAAAIRDAAKKGKYMKLTEISEVLEADKTFALELLDEMMALPDYEDLRMYKSSKDRYYYSYPTIANNYVRGCALAEEGNLEGIIAEVVRYESKRYPRATIIDTFTRFPYHYTKEQVKSMLAVMEGKKEYGDIQTYTSQKGNLYIFSTNSLTPQYAKALVEIGEDVKQWF